MTTRPNIVQITTHDSGRHFGCYGHSTLQTPAIDQLAADGVRLTNYFCASPICCASRAAQLTGLYPQSNGQVDLCFPPFNWRLREDVPHLSQLLKAASYRTLLCGVQHEVNEAGTGLGVCVPTVMEFHGGFSGQHGDSRDKSVNTGCMAPVTVEVLDHNREHGLAVKAEDRACPVRLLGPMTFWRAEVAPRVAVRVTSTAGGTMRVFWRGMPPKEASLRLGQWAVWRKTWWDPERSVTAPIPAVPSIMAKLLIMERWS